MTAVPLNQVHLASNIWRTPNKRCYVCTILSQVPVIYEADIAEFLTHFDWMCSMETQGNLQIIGRILLGNAYIYIYVVPCQPCTFRNTYSDEPSFTA